MRPCEKECDNQALLRTVIDFARHQCDSSENFMNEDNIQKRGVTRFSDDASFYNPSTQKQAPLQTRVVETTVSLNLCKNNN